MQLYCTNSSYNGCIGMLSSNSLPNILLQILDTLLQLFHKKTKWSVSDDSTFSSVILLNHLPCVLLLKNMNFQHNVLKNVGTYICLQLSIQQVHFQLKGCHNNLSIFMSLRLENDFPKLFAVKPVLMTNCE